MANQLLTWSKYAGYLLKGKTKYYIHSPFVFSFINEVLFDKRIFYCYTEVEELRKRLKRADELIDLVDYGAGSVAGSKNKHIRTVKEIASTSAKPPKYARLLFRTAAWFKCREMLEIGTSLGLTTCYLSAVSQNSHITTLEGNPGLVKLAYKHFELLNRKNISLIEGNFGDTLPIAINHVQQLDFVFFDGNHRREATLSYFNQCLVKAHNDSIFAFDDIYWSKEMSEAWEEIKNHPRVTLTIDLFSLGLVFFRKENKKEHFVLYF